MKNYFIGKLERSSLTNTCEKNMADEQALQEGGDRLLDLTA
jgi:hypothetical protein